MTSPNSKPHRPKQMPPFWDELTGTEREIWQTLTDEERRTLSEFYEADPNIYPIKIALANKRTSAEPEALGAAEPTPSSPTPPTRREETDEERKRKADLARRAERWNRETPTQRTERLEREQRPNRRRERAAASAPPARRAEARQTAQALESAEESAGILSALARLCWPEAHDGEECPQEHIPTMDDLCPFLFDVPDQAQAALALAALLEDITQDANFHDLDPDQFRWEWTTFALTPIERPPQGLSKWKTFVDSIKTDLAAMLRYQEEGETLRVAIPGRNRPEVPVFIPLETVHQVWKATPPQDRPPHPLLPIVAAWQDRPTPIDPDRGAKPIVSGTLTKRINRETPQAPALDVVDVPDLVPYQTDLFTPALGDVPSLVKTLYDVPGGTPTRQGRAPLAAVLWLEGLLSIPTQYRDGQLHSIDFTRREIYEHWAGCDARNWDHRKAARQDLALGRMTNTTVAVGEGWYKPLLVQATEGPHLSSRVSLLVRLPPEAQQGPAVPRRILRKLLTSKLAWLGLINICIHLDRYGGRQGRLIAADRPEVKRNEQGHILDHKGEPIRNKRGYPTNRYTDPRALPDRPARTQPRPHSIPRTRQGRTDCTVLPAFSPTE